MNSGPHHLSIDSNCMLGQNLGLAPTIDLLKHNPTEGTSQNQDEMLTKVLGNQQLDRASSLKTGQPLYGDGSDDLGYESADDGQFETQASAAGHKSAQQLTSNIDFEDSGVLSRDGNDLVSSTTSNIVSSSTTRYTGTQTPLKAEKPVSTDSAISMSFNTFDEAEVEKSTIKYRDGSESPLARKGARGKQNMLENQSSRPAPTPLQPVPIAIGIRRKMIPFEQPFVKMKTYIKKPLVTELDMKEGYIYGFGIDGCSYTKIGYVTERSNSASLEDAFIARMNEHKRCYLPKPTIMLKIRVPHAHRMEKIIHYHLEAGRMKYKCYCKKVNEDKPGTGNHTEWFNQSLNEIHAVANAWKDWIRSNPYVEDQSGGRRVYHLSKEWKSRLENVPNANGRDNWLDWLHHYSPVPPQLINKAKSDEIFEKSSTGPVNGSFVRHSTIGTRFEIKRATTFSFS